MGEGDAKKGRARGKKRKLIGRRRKGVTPGDDIVRGVKGNERRSTRVRTKTMKVKLEE